MTDSEPHAERGPIERDLEIAETIESSAMQNAVAVGGPGAVIMVPIASALTALSALVRKAGAKVRR